ncbi:MAG TPA: TetR/AcrR family transcriptional regulator [Terriglobales bacterium]|nr:TetR/AcrR family transcriptional regulator [Terriglobales bacterium]
MAPRSQPAARRLSRPGPRGDSEQTRAAILKAALEEFAQEGLAGARIDHIARAARVNKALLYYYFRDKEALYGATLEHVFSGLADRLRGVLEQDLPPREKIIALAGAHFDYIAASPIYPRVVQRELMRAGRSGSPHIQRIYQRYLAPLKDRLVGLFAEGMARGDFRPVHPLHFFFSMVAMNVFYFSSLPMLRLLLDGDPLAPERVAARRAAVLDFVAAALFTAPRAEQPSATDGKDES